MDNVITIFSSPARRPPATDLGVIDITDSEPEDLDNIDPFWTEQKKTAGIDAFPRLYEGVAKEDSPMDIEAPAAVAGPSTRSPVLDPFPDAPVFAGIDSQTTQEADIDPYSKHLALILEVVPDVLPQRALELIEELYPVYGDQVGEWVVQKMLDDPPSLEVAGDVAVTGKGKRKASEMEGAGEEPPSKVKIDFASVDRPGPTGADYRTLTLNQLYADFPYVPVSHVRHALNSNNGLYAPTHIQLNSEIESGAPPFKLKTVKTIIYTGKGKQREMQDQDFEIERAWLLLKDDRATLDSEKPLKDRIPGGVETPIMNSDAQFEGGDIECGCCFSPASFHNMIQCPDAHLFCIECMVAYASNLLGEHNFKIVCMDQSGCKLPFPESELKRFLTPKLLSLYEKIKQAKEIEMAGLDGLEECPHCEFKVVIDNPEERLFRCQNEECGAVTCRECKKPDHLPRSCAEVDEDKKIDARHVVEEAMTNALLRNCPKCNKVFIKESGCNKMTCPNCKTLSCYVCRAVITGYDHFNESRPGQAQRPGQAGKCKLWDKVEERHEKEVEEAQKQAIAEYRKEHPEMGEDALKVELPKTTSEAGGSEGQRQQAHLPPRYERINPLLPVQVPELNRYRQRLAAARARVLEVQLPRPQQNAPQLDPAMADHRRAEVQRAQRQPVENTGQPQEGNLVHKQELPQKRRDHAGKFVGNNSRNPRPAALPDNIVNPTQRPRGNRTDGARMNPAGRGRGGRWRVAVDPRPGDGAAL